MPEQYAPRSATKDPGDYLEALARLKDNAPNDRDLKKKADAGKLRISISSVALEAKRARTPIAVKDPESPYFGIHLAIIAAAGLVPASSKAAKKGGRLTLQAVVTNLRRDLKKLAAERDLAALRVNDAVDTARDFEKRALKAEKDLRNLRREIEGRPPRDTPIPPKPKGPPPDNIIKFPRDR